MGQIEKNTVSSQNQVWNNTLIENAEGTGKRILFLGNSITLHGKTESIGWMNDCGMAASSIEKDYVHRIASAVQKKDPDAVFCICNAADWEREYANGESQYGTVEGARQFCADIIVMRVIENCPREGFDKALFKEQYSKLIQFLSPDHTTKAILTSSFWKRDGDDAIQEVAEEAGMDFVYLGDLGEQACMRADGLYEHGGVAHHPGDLGMQVIAERIFDKMEKFIQ